MKQNKIVINLDKKKTYLLACSFGPDSMALLDLIIKNKINVVVAHVNYHHREESNYEEQSLREYCKQNLVPIEVFDCKGLVVKGNFEAWAREIRYEFFSNLGKKLKITDVLVAHHQDDLIETYLMQKKRDKYYKNFGIAESIKIKNINVVRPLLSFKKRELIDYCKKNKVPYSIDKTNLTNDYERNNIRHNIIEKLSDNDRKEILNEIASKKKIDVENKNSWLVNEFLQLSYPQIVMLIDQKMCLVSEHRNLSKKFVDDIKKSLGSKKANMKIKITDSLFLCKSYEFVYLIQNDLLQNYKIVVKKPGKFSNIYIEGDFSIGQEERNVKISDYPITIENLKPSDTINIDSYHCKVNRLFIDWKMPLYLRDFWPGIYNNKKELIYVPRYRKDFIDNHKSKFVIKINSILGIDK